MHFIESTRPIDTDWWTRRLHPFAQDVGSLVPDVMPSYARILHPVVEADGVRTRWSEVARRSGKAIHPEVQFHALLGTDAGERDSRLSWGSFPSAELAALTETLQRHTRTPDAIWAGVWIGFAQLRQLVPDAMRYGQRTHAEHREYLLFGGRLDEIPIFAGDLDIGPFDQSPNVLWPDDRSWFVATEIDLAWTYVGGSASLIDAIVGDGRLEAIEVAVSDSFQHDSDLVNERPDGPVR